MLTPRRIIVLTAATAVGFWLAGAALDAWVFLEGDYPHELLNPGLDDTCIRVLAIAVILATGLAWSRQDRRGEDIRRGLESTAVNYRRLVDATPDCVIVHAGGLPLFANCRALEFLGYPDLEALAEQTIEEIVHPKDRQAVADRLRGASDPDGTAAPVEVRVLHRDGGSADVLAHGVPIRYDGRDAVLTVFRDISAEVETRRDLMASRERLSLALEAARDGIWDWDIPADRMVYSASWAEMLGLDLEDVAKDRSTWEALAHPDDRDRATALFHAHLAGKTPVYETEVRLRHADGHYIWVLDRGKVVRRGRDGEPLRMTGTHRDITGRKEAELALEVRNRLAGIFLTRTGSGSGIDQEVLDLVCAAAGSPAGMLGKLEGDGDLRIAAGRPADSTALIPADRIAGIAEQVIRGNRSAMSAGIVDVDGSGHTFAGALAVPISVRDQVLGVIVVGDRAEPYRETDLSLLESLAAYLAPILRSHRANELAESSLRRAQKMEALGALAGGIAHDFNNILQAILGFTTLARDEAPPGTVLARDLDRALKATRRGEELVQRILLFSRREEQETQELAVEAMVQETVDLLRPTLPATIELVVDIAPDAGRVLADPARMSQALLNLATNAFHAMEAEGGTLGIAVRRVAASTAGDVPPELGDRDLVAISFRDTGCGMDRGVLDRLFDPFYTTKAVGKGTGLGLSVVHGIVIAHGGDIRVASEPGHGTVVTVYLPLLEDSATEAAAVADPRAANILFVDDDPTIVDVATGMLQRRGFAVRGCVGGRAALAALARNPEQYDLLITDASMPDVDGGAVVTRWREVRPGRPVVVITGHARADLPAQVDTGSARVLNKPFDTEALLTTVEDALSGAGPGTNG